MQLLFVSNSENCQNDKTRKMGLFVLFRNYNMKAPNKVRAFENREFLRVGSIIGR
jgi:hypothetical protein